MNNYNTEDFHPSLIHITAHQHINADEEQYAILPSIKNKEPTTTTTMNPLQRALRPTSRRILATRLAPAAVQARRLQSNGAGTPFDPVVDGEMGVGELEGAQFKIEPLRRVGEDPETMRARLTCAFLIFVPFPVPGVSQALRPRLSAL